MSKDLLKVHEKDFLRLIVNYRKAEDKLPHFISYNCPGNYISFDKIIKPLQFATAVTMYGLKLRESKFFPNKSWESIKELATSALTSHNFQMPESNFCYHE